MGISTIQYVIMFYFLLSMVLGGILAYYKGDFISRGLSIGMFSGIFGPIFMYFSSPSKARNEESKAVWPNRAPEATLLNILFLTAVYLVISGKI